MAARRAKGLPGAAKFRRLLKRLPDEASTELVAELQRAGPILLALAKSETPSKTGAARAALAFKVFPKTLRLSVGYLTKIISKRFFYISILEGGRREYTRKGKNAPRRIGAISPNRYDIVRGRTEDKARAMLRPILNASFERALQRAGGPGGGDD